MMGGWHAMHQLTPLTVTVTSGLVTMINVPMAKPAKFQLMMHTTKQKNILPARVTVKSF
jgi:hypothetical protein